jgi:hypothetical protein
VENMNLKMLYAKISNTLENNRYIHERMKIEIFLRMAGVYCQILGGYTAESTNAEQVCNYINFLYAADEITSVEADGLIEILNIVSDHFQTDFIKEI